METRTEEQPARLCHRRKPLCSWCSNVAPNQPTAAVRDPGPGSRTPGDPHQQAGLEPGVEGWRARATGAGAGGAGGGIVRLAEPAAGSEGVTPHQCLLTVQAGVAIQSLPVTGGTAGTPPAGGRVVGIPAGDRKSGALDGLQ